MAYEYNPYAGAAGGAIGAGMGGLFSDWKNPYGQSYAKEMQDYIRQYMGPYAEAGQRQIPQLEEQYKQLLGSPGDFINRVGGQYQKSPGFDFALKQALQGAGHAAAAGGMAGSPQHEFENMGIATQMANQDYMNWLKTALGQYDIGLGGAQGMFGTGAQMGMGMGEDLASIMHNEQIRQYLEQMSENERSGGMWGSMLGGLGAIGGGLLGGALLGPGGAAAGSSIGGTIGGHFGRS